jgi:ABC-type transport system involved in multi-copper enzyme maturation permease subunit
MTPYVSILKDSFREAFASRVLWILLVVVTLLLAILAGFGMQEHAGASFASEDLLDAAVLYNKLKSDAQASYPNAGKRIWSVVDERTKAELAETVAESESLAFGNPLATRLSGMLNRLLSNRDLYESESWSSVRLDSETEELLAIPADQLSDEQLARLNRLLIESAYPLEIAPSRNLELYVSYWGSVLGTPLPLRKDFVIKTSLVLLSNFVVGMIGVFCGIVVTASIIPQTFEAGAIDLLLSKPISRPLLFLTKFAGGCTFMLIITAYILAGLWLVVGLRQGVWHPELVWCIPVFLFVFAVYYSVSALAGVIWRNTIVSIVVTFLFWAVCWGLGVTKGFVIENFFFEPVRPVRLVAADEDLIAANERGDIQQWDDDNGRWEEILVPDEAPRWRPFRGGLPLAGPIYQPEEERLVVVQRPNRRFSLISSMVPLVLGRRDEGWRRREGVSVPADTSVLGHDPEGKLIAVAASGIYRQNTDLAARQRTDLTIFGMRLPAAFNPGASGFEQVYATRLTRPYSAAVNPENGEVAIYNREVLSIYAANEAGRYEERLRKELAGTESAVVACAGDTVLLGTADGVLRVYTYGDLSVRASFEPVPGVAPRFLEASPDGRRFAVLLHDRTVWIYRADQNQLFRAPVDGQEDVAGIAFDGDDHLLVSDRVSRVTRYSLPAYDLVDRVESEPEWLEVLYRYAVVPLYTIFPKPSEISNITAYLIADQRTIGRDQGETDLRARQIPLDLWGPIWSNLAFLAVVLFLGCLYTSRTDF